MSSKFDRKAVIIARKHKLAIVMETTKVAMEFVTVEVEEVEEGSHTEQATQRIQ